MDWRTLEPLTANGLVTLALKAAGETKPWVEESARISHVGFRSEAHVEWERLLEVMRPLGEVCMTFKADGRKIPFIKLTEPLELDGDALEYIELPAPKPVTVSEPNMLVVYRIAGKTRQPLIKGGYDVREQTMHARDFIERDKERT